MGSLKRWLKLNVEAMGVRPSPVVEFFSLQVFTPEWWPRRTVRRQDTCRMGWGGAGCVSRWEEGRASTRIKLSYTLIMDFKSSELWVLLFDLLYLWYFYFISCPISTHPVFELYKSTNLKKKVKLFYIFGALSGKEHMAPAACCARRSSPVNNVFFALCDRMTPLTILSQVLLEQLSCNMYNVLYLLVHQPLITLL